MVTDSIIDLNAHFGNEMVLQHQCSVIDCIDTLNAGLCKLVLVELCLVVLNTSCVLCSKVFHLWIDFENIPDNITAVSIAGQTEVLIAGPILAQFVGGLVVFVLVLSLDTRFGND